MRNWTLAVFLLIAFKAAYSAQIPPGYINSVVALGSIQQVPVPSDHPGGAPQQTKWLTEGTGFLYGSFTEIDSSVPPPNNKRYRVFLVTAKHVVQEHCARLHTDLDVRLNAKDPSKGGQGFSIPNQPPAGEGGWFFHPDPKIDIAVVVVDLNKAKQQGFEPDWFASDAHAANKEKLKSLEVSAGDGIFALGFPMNLAGEQRNYVIVREGVIARISEMLDGASQTFMVDSFVFPGNSGSPVVLRPEILSIAGTKSQNTAYLIGIVLSYIPYQDVAISPQTGRARISFEENSGLAQVLPVDYIDETIKAYIDSVNATAQKKKGDKTAVTQAPCT
jgi:hypothetical protein